ncbi:hypothetical protein FXE12_12285 [Lactobacillus sp. SL9-6]|nr:hypothetical protein FXE12_12285 [Lactobacillus sp. SL9-6]
MTTEELITMATNSRNLNTQSHLLSVTYHIPATEANSLILTRFYERVHDRDIQPDKVDWIVTFSRKDVQRSLGKEASYHNQHVADDIEMDSLVNPSTEVADELSDDVLAKIFPNDRSFQFVTEVLKHGKEETMAKFNLSNNAFRSRLNHKVKYCHDHSDLISSILDTEERKNMESEKQLIQVLLDDIDSPLLEDDADLNSAVRTFFDYYPVLHDWLEDAKEQLGLKYEAKVVNNFTNSDKDGRLFLQYLYQKLDSINSQLKGSN